MLHRPCSADFGGDCAGGTLSGGVRKGSVISAATAECIAVADGIALMLLMPLHLLLIAMLLLSVLLLLLIALMLISYRCCLLY